MLNCFAVAVLALLCLGTAAGDNDLNSTACVDLFQKSYEARVNTKMDLAVDA